MIHSFWVPRINGKRDVVPGRIQTLRLEANEPGIYAGQCAEFCGLSHANMRMEIVALTAEDFETWKADQLAEYEAPEAGTEAADGEAVFIQQCARCHQVNGLVGSDGEPVIAHPEDNVYAGAAPNLTHLMSRNTFAGATFDLLTPSRREVVWDAPPEEFGASTSRVSPPRSQRPRAARVDPQRPSEEADVHRPRGARPDQWIAPRHARPRPLRGPDRRRHRLPAS